MPADASFQTWLVVLGAIIGFASSILTTIVTMLIQRFIDSRGKVRIYYRFSLSEDTDRKPWNFQNTAAKVEFEIPIEFEFQNTTNTTRVIRDVSLFLFDGDKQVFKMYQGTSYHEKIFNHNTVTNTIDFVYGDNGSYSYVLPPSSIQKKTCFYFFSIPNQETERYHFDNIRLRYYNEKNHEIWCKVRQVSDCWKPKVFAADDEWNLLKK